MTSTNTNKQPVFVDRPLITCSRITSEVVGNANTLFVQGGQAPVLLVDMDATLSTDNNSGGIIDAIRIQRDNTSVADNPDYTVNTATSGTYIGLNSGQVVYIEETGVLSNASQAGVGYYTFTGTTASGGVNTDITYSTAGGFTYISPNQTVAPSVTFVAYLVNGTEQPIPGNGDYRILFSKTLGEGVMAADCSDVMPESTVPVPVEGNTAGLGDATPLKNRVVVLQRGQRLYMGVQQRGAYNTQSGYIPGAHVTAQGGFY
tara:strand:- start:481 stop:1260 length:780 start_codon:yes stop_codon:yes gene_type:complete